MEWIKRLQDSINYMEDHILEDINYEDVAKIVCMSSYYFHRTFSLMSGMTVNTYIRNRRLSLAGQELQTTNISVIDAAYKYGYETPESFSKAFSRFHGVTPKQAKLKGTQLHLFNPFVIKLNLEGGSIMDYRIEKKGKQSFLAKVRVFSNDIIGNENDRSIPDFWSECDQKNYTSTLLKLRPAGKKDMFGLCSPAKKGSDTFHYGVAILLDNDTDCSNLDTLLQEGYSIWETEPTEYVVLKCFGENESCIGQMWTKFFKEFLPQSNYEQNEATDYEVYYDNGEKGLFCELWIPIKEK